jgi:naphthoate synthase
MAIKMLKFAMNLTDDGMVGQQVLLVKLQDLAYMTEEAKKVEMLLEKKKTEF